VSWLVSFFALLIAYSPRSGLVPLTWFIKRCYFTFARKEVRQLYRNLDKVLGIPSHSSFAKTFAEQNLHLQILIALETMREVYRGNQIEIAGYSEFEHQINALKEQGRGLIIVTAHQGSWELLSQQTSKACGGDLHVLAKPARLPALTRALDKFRERGGTKVLWTDSKALLRDMLRVLRSGGALGFVMDQKPQNRIGHTVSFFGHPTEFVTGPATMAKKTGAPVAAIFCVRTGAFRYRLTLRLVTEDPASFEEEELTAKMVDAMEKEIRTYPEQWTWTYRRWKFAD
jgi:KDO2-lipid IV(A) lauroyltransferase